MFKIYLDNCKIYLLEIGFNFDKYKIKKGYLYEGIHKLGKILRIETLNLR